MNESSSEGDELESENEQQKASEQTKANKRAWREGEWRERVKAFKRPRERKAIPRSNDKEFYNSLFLDSIYNSMFLDY